MSLLKFPAGSPSVSNLAELAAVRFVRSVVMAGLRGRIVPQMADRKSSERHDRDLARVRLPSAVVWTGQRGSFDSEHLRSRFDREFEWS